MARVDLQRYMDAVKSHHPYPNVQDEGLRRLTAFRSFFEKISPEDAWTTFWGQHTIELGRMKVLAPDVSLVQTAGVNIETGRIHRTDTIKALGPINLPKKILHRFGGNPDMPQTLELNTVVGPDPDDPENMTLHRQHATWLFDGPHPIQFGGEFTLHDSPTHEFGGGMVHPRLHIAVSRSSSFSPDGFRKKQLLLDTKHAGRLIDGDLALPIGVLWPFDDIFSVKLQQQTLDVAANLLRGNIHRSLTSPNIPVHPAFVHWRSEAQKAGISDRIPA